MTSEAETKKDNLRSIVITHCKDKMLKIWNKYSQKRNIGASVPISTFMCLWANYIFPRRVCLFCWRKYVCWLILGIYKSLKDTWMWKLGLRPRYSQKRNILTELPLQCIHSTYTLCAAGFALLNLPKGKSLGRSKPETNSYAQAHATHCVGFLLYPSSAELPNAK